MAKAQVRKCDNRNKSSCCSRTPGNYGDLSQAIAKLYMQVDSLTKENIELKDLLKKNGIPYGG